MDKILIVDDSIVQSKKLEEILHKTYELETISDSQAVVMKAETSQPSLILLDVIMPVKDGFQVLSELKDNEKTASIPVILITSLSDIGNEEKGLKLGAVDYITKPFSPAIVKARIHTHIQLYNYRKTIEHLAMFDALTGLPNRRAYDTRMAKEWARAKAQGSPLSIALLDIDYFKQYNDNFGHPAGDALLYKVGSLLSKRLEKERDFAARYGGEEFIFLLPDSDIPRGFLFCERTRKCVEDLQIMNTLPSGDPCRLSVSIGGATIIPGENDSFEEFIKQVDRMLYKAKKTGKNMVIWAE